MSTYTQDLARARRKWKATKEDRNAAIRRIGKFLGRAFSFHAMLPDEHCSTCFELSEHGLYMDGSTEEANISPRIMNAIYETIKNEIAYRAEEISDALYKHDYLMKLVKEIEDAETEQESDGRIESLKEHEVNNDYIMGEKMAIR